MAQINHKHRLASQSSEIENILKINQTNTDEQTKKNSFVEEEEEYFKIKIKVLIIKVIDKCDMISHRKM